jgi:hypothetical protein
MSHYRATSTKGDRVKIARRDVLTEFRNTWRHQHPPDLDQIVFAGEDATVKSFGSFNGREVLYELDGIPGLWHERCLVPADPVSFLDRLRNLIRRILGRA